MKLLPLIPVVIASLLYTAAFAQSSAAWGPTISDAPGTYLDNSGNYSTTLTWEGAGLRPAGLVDASHVNTFAFNVGQAFPPSQTASFAFDTLLTDDDGYLETVGEVQRGNYQFVLHGGAIWTAAEILMDFDVPGGYTVTGVGTDTINLNRTGDDGGDPNAFAVAYWFNISGAFDGLDLTWTPGGGASGAFPTDMVGLDFGNLTAVPVPEPSSGFLVFGAAMLGLLRRRRQK